MAGSLRVFVNAIRIFSRNNCFDRAAVISYYAFLSLMPIMLLLTSALGLLLGARADILDNLIGMARTRLPYLSERMITDIKGLASASTTFGWVSLIVLLFTAEFVLKAMADALIDIFDVHERYGFFRRRVLNALIAFMAVFAALVSIIVTAAAGIVSRINVRVLGIDLAYWLIESLTLKYILPFVIVVLTVTAVFQVFSGPNLRLRYAFYGSLIFAVLWETGKQCFALYIHYFPTYNRFYGSLGTIMLLLIWIYFSASIFLFSASIARAAFMESGGNRRSNSRRQRPGKGGA